MKNEIKKYLFRAAGILLLIILLTIIFSGYVSRNNEIEKLKVELAHAQIHQPMQYTVIHDTIPVASSKVNVVSKSSYKQSFADQEELKELDVKSGQVGSQEIKTVEIHDTVRLSSSPSLGTYNYKDRWVTFLLSLKDSALYYSVRDSLKTYVVRQYKHHFLFWHWGTKGYEVKILNYNPHAKIKYESFIMVN
ncbi:MAG: hypothetical protein LKE54_04365 [Prevotella sp.]|nr:hypothetical protein [Prevotella sp.]